MGDDRAPAAQALANAAVANGVLLAGSGVTGKNVLQAWLLRQSPVLLNCCFTTWLHQAKYSQTPTCICSGLPGQTAAPTVGAPAAAAAPAAVLNPFLTIRQLPLVLSATQRAWLPLGRAPTGALPLSYCLEFWLSCEADVAFIG